MNYNQTTKDAIAQDKSLKNLSNSLFNLKNKKLLDLSLSQIVVKEQVRKTFDDDEIIALAESIAKHGQLQPITVYPLNQEKYHLVCGEKRYRACLLNDAKTILAYVISKPNEDELVALQIIENLQRSDPPTIEIASALGKLKQAHDVKSIAELISCKATYVYDLLKIDKLNDEEKELFKKCKKTFLLCFSRVKELDPEEAQRVYDTFSNAEDKSIAEDECLSLLNLVLSKNKQEKKKICGIKQQQKSRTISISYKRLNKLAPNIVETLNQHIEKNKEPVELIIAKALEQYFKQND